LKDCQPFIYIAKFIPIFAIAAFILYQTKYQVHGHSKGVSSWRQIHGYGYITPTFPCLFGKLLGVMKALLIDIGGR